ncbi:MAG TPA: hypothetical protein VMY78_18870 [Solirubrobacteraceae bacterium]|nr:hypothetical protein [Solirubrobacteraceae bacterium]
MDAFSLSLVVFTAMMVALLVAIFWGAFDDPLPQKASSTWAVTCPLGGLLYGLGIAPLAVIFAAVSVLALGSLAYWFMVTEPDDGEDEAEEPVQPDPGPSDELVIEVPQQPAVQAHAGIDWDEFDRARADWEQEPVREPLPSGV